MTATLHARTPLTAWGPLQDAAAQFRDECAAWEQATHDLFTDLDRLREELSTKAHELDEGRRRLAERGRQLADQRKEANRLAQLLEQQEARLAEALGELRGLREQLDAERTESRKREAEQTAALQKQLTTLHDQVARLQRERDELKQLLDLSKGDGGGASPAQVVEPLLAHFVELKQEMDATRSELAAAMERVTSGSRASGGSSDPSAAIEDLAKLHELEKEHVELESELELVRARAAELQELVGQLKSELSEQRGSMADELRELRRLLGHPAEASGHRETQVYAPRDEASPAMTMTLPARDIVRDSTPAKEKVRDSTPVAAANGDPAAQSVMAQFAKLQKDVALRRKKK